MKPSLAAWLTSWSIARVAKSTNMTSTTGRSPVAAAPVAIPMTVASLIGVSRILPFPNSSARPLVAPNGPP